MVLSREKITDIEIRAAGISDFEEIENILKENNMIVPDIDGKDAMSRICMSENGRYFLAAKRGEEVVGFVRAVYDGSRALIHQMAVRKTMQNQGIGKKLIHELCTRLKSYGAPTVSVTVTKESALYYEKLSFEKLPITLMLANNIDEVLNRTKK